MFRAQNSICSNCLLSFVAYRFTQFAPVICPNQIIKRITQLFVVAVVYISFDFLSFPQFYDDHFRRQLQFASDSTVKYTVDCHIVHSFNLDVGRIQERRSSVTSTNTPPIS